MKRAEKRSIILNLDDYEWLKLIENEQIGRLFLILYQKYRGEKYIVTKDILVPFTVITTSVDQYNERWKAECLRRSEAGKKGNMIRWKSQSIAKIADKEMEYEKENEKEIIIEIKKFFLFVRFVCPVQPEFERFWHHYEKNSWLDGNGVLITNKIACAMNWIIDEKTLGSRVDVNLTKAWKTIYELLKDKENSKLMITDLRGFKKKENTLIIFCSKALCDFVESNMCKEIETAIKTGFVCEYVEYDFAK